MPNPTFLLKAITLVLAVWVLVLAGFSPLSTKAGRPGLSDQESIDLLSSFQSDPLLPGFPKPLPKLNILFFILPELWEVVQAIAARRIQESRALFLAVFLQKINFVFVSAKAP